MNGMRLNSSKLLMMVVFAAFLVLVPSELFAQASVEIRGKAGVTSATIDNTSGGDPVFDIGGGLQAAALIKFVGGIAAGLNFNWYYDSHTMRSTAGSGSTGTMSFSSPSFGIIARYGLGPNVDAGAWVNYVFGSTTADFSASGTTDNEWDVQGFELGGELKLAYQMKPYRTYILAGVFAYGQYLTLFQSAGSGGDMSAQNIGGGALLGVRFDFKL